MNYNNDDIIIAQSTPIGSSALAVIRVSGSSLVDFLPLLLNKKLYDIKKKLIEKRKFNDNYYFKYIVNK